MGAAINKAASVFKAYSCYQNVISIFCRFFAAQCCHKCYSLAFIGLFCYADSLADGSVWAVGSLLLGGVAMLIESYATNLIIIIILAVAVHSWK